MDECVDSPLLGVGTDLGEEELGEPTRLPVAAEEGAVNGGAVLMEPTLLSMRMATRLDKSCAFPPAPGGRQVSVRMAQRLAVREAHDVVRPVRGRRRPWAAEGHPSRSSGSSPGQHPGFADLPGHHLDELLTWRRLLRCAGLDLGLDVHLHPVGALPPDEVEHLAQQGDP